jgi:hypothetical protein
MLKSHSFMGGGVRGVCQDFGYGLDLDDCISYIPQTVHQQLVFCSTIIYMP